MVRDKDIRQPHSITTWQQISFITSTLIGIGVLTLPRTATSTMRESGWLAVMAGAIIPIFSIWMIAWLSKRFAGLTFIQYSEIIWGVKGIPVLGKIFSFPWIFLFLGFQLVTTAATSRVFGEVVVTAVLLNTPLEVLIISMFLLALVLCFHEVEVVARINELLFPLILFPVLFIALTSFQKAEWNNVLPIFISSWTDLAKGAIETSFSYQGYELMLIFFAFALPETNRARAGFYGIGLAMIVYTLIVLAGIVVFGHDELQRLTWPTLELVKNTQVRILILERLESAFIGVWVAAVFTTVANTYYGFIYGLRQYMGKGMLFQRISAIVMLIPLFYISLIPQNIEQLFKITEYIAYLGIAVTTGIPLVYIIVTLLRGARKRE